VRFSEPWFWGFIFYEIQCLVIGWVVPNVLKGQEVPAVWKWLAGRHSAIPQKAWFFHVCMTCLSFVFKAVTTPKIYFCWSVTARRRCHRPRPATLKQPRNCGRWVRSWLGWGTGTPPLLLTSHHRPARLHTPCSWRAVALHVVDIYHTWQAASVTFIATVILILYIPPVFSPVPQTYFFLSHTCQV
jgi:hypothetical protein